MPKFKTMSDAYGRLGLYKRVESNVPCAMEGWELIADEIDFPAVLEAIPRLVESE